MLTQSQIDRLKPGDKVRFVNLPDEGGWEKYNGTIVTVVKPKATTIPNLLEFEPKIIREHELNGDKYIHSSFHLHYNWAELVEEPHNES